MKKLNKEAIFTPLAVTFMLLMLLLSNALSLTNASSASELLLRSAVLQVLIFVLPSIFLARVFDVKYVKDSSWRLFAPSRIMLIITLLAVMVTGSFLISVGSALLSGADSTQGVSDSSVTELYSQISGRGGAWLSALSICIIPAICEEFAFRGVLLTCLRRGCRAFPAAIVSALMFSIVHLDPGTLVQNFFCGLVLSFTVIVTRSVAASMVLHSLYNLTLLFALPYIWKMTLEPMGVLFTVFMLGALFLLCIAASLGEAQAIYGEYALEIYPDPEEQKLRKMSVTQGFINALKSPFLYINIIIFVLAVRLK